MATSAPAGWLPGWVAPAALAATAAVGAATVCWQALCRLASGRRVADGPWPPPDPPKGSRTEGQPDYVKKGGHGALRPGGGIPKGTIQLRAQCGIPKKYEERGGPLYRKGVGGSKPMGRPIRLLMTSCSCPCTRPAWSGAWLRNFPSLAFPKIARQELRWIA
jgi:hypothetical protein